MSFLSLKKTSDFLFSSVPTKKEMDASELASPNSQSPSTSIGVEKEKFVLIYSI